MIVYLASFSKLTIPITIYNISIVYLPYDYASRSYIVFAVLNEYINDEIPIWINVSMNAIHQYVSTNLSPIISKYTGSESVYSDGSIVIPLNALSIYI